MRGLKYGASVGAYARFLCVYFGVYATETDVVYATETDVSSSYIVSFFARCLLGKGNNFMDMVTVNSAYYDKQDTSNEYAGRKFDCINSTNSAHPVPVNVEEVKDIVSVAKYILIVEKESVFQRLANDHFCKKKTSALSSQEEVIQMFPQEGHLITVHVYLVGLPFAGRIFTKDDDVLHLIRVSTPPRLCWTLDCFLRQGVIAIAFSGVMCAHRVAADLGKYDVQLCLQ
ncbi:hypothetical protein POM88_053002 [Heracleum sosnowskyi]|uniref:Uncharacterized protein n=1 Tax=Heracleum sosnowskyi TaxID=360622 RepID=A0AAD8LYS2_9APIA|nr:hypothetical protein POM88_053002 [Heracleum sosnowskyi]